MSRLLKFLRYNTRHMLHMQDGRLWLNPISYSSHNRDRTRTRSWSEPLWAFRLRQRWFAHAGRTMCQGAEATWDLGPDGCRTCSYCGSIHFEDLMGIVDRVEADPRYGVEGTSKRYKLYITQPGVRNASEGAIKAYTWHFPSVPLPADEDARLRAAMRLTHQRFMERMERDRQARAAR